MSFFRSYFSTNQAIDHKNPQLNSTWMSKEVNRYTTIVPRREISFFGEKTGFVAINPERSIYKVPCGSVFAGHLERTRFRLHFLTRDLAPLLLSDEDSFMAAVGAYDAIKGGNCSKRFFGSWDV